MKIRTRLFIAFLILVGLGFYKLVDWITDDLRPRYLETMEESMVDTATILSSSLANQVNDGSIAVGDLRAIFDTAHSRRFSAKIYAMTKTSLDMRVYVVDRNGTVLFDSDKGRDEGKDYSQWNDVVRTMRGEYGARTTHTTPDDPATAILHVASPIIVGDEIIGTLTVCKPADSVALFVEAAKKKIMLAGILAAIAVVLLGAVVSSWITSPIEKLTDYAKGIRDGQRVSPPKLGRNEIGALGAAFEEMRDALEGKQYAEKYVQTLTHEMKSPLSAIQGAVELLQEDMPPEQRRQFLGNVRAESARIQDLVERLLQLSALETRKELRDVEQIDLLKLLREVLESMTPLFAARGITVATDGHAPVTVSGERFLVRQALSNLLQNAVDFSQRDGRVSVALRTKGDTVELTVSDNGPGMPEYARDKVFDRFYSLTRPDTGKKSSGLGLAVVREVAVLHGGMATLENRPEGGAIAALVLPIDQSHRAS